MRSSLTKILLMAAAFCLTASVGQAAVGHAHHHHPDSPFVGQQDAKHPHCVLKGHSMDKPCPHMVARHGGNNGQPVIANECGGTPLPSNSHRIGSENIFSISEMMFDGSVNSNPGKISSVISFYNRIAF